MRIDSRWRRALGAGTVAAAIMIAVGSTGTASAAANPLTAPFTECPAIGAAPSCQILLVVNSNDTISVLGDSSVGPYDGSDDTLVGVVNNSAKPVPAITVSGPGSGLAGFDEDGICTYANNGNYCDTQQLSGTDPEDYAGPGTSFTLDPKSQDDVEVDFAGSGLAAGAATYFSLEGALTAASLTSRTGKLPSLKITTSVSNHPIVPDPGPDASVKFTLTATNSDGTPAAHATVTMSNAKPGATFHTNAKGVLTLIEPVTVQPGSPGGAMNIVTAQVIAANGTTGSAAQELYNTTQYAACSFDGKPGLDTSLLDNMLPDVGGFSLSGIQTLIENLAPWLGGYHTNVAGYTITVPKARNIYAQTLQITHRGKTTYSGTGYSRHKILQVSSNLFDQIQSGCAGGPSNLA